MNNLWILSGTLSAIPAAPTPEDVGHGSGLVEDGFVVTLVGGDDVVRAESFLGVDAGDFAHFAAAVGTDPKRNRQPQDPGSQTQPGALAPIRRLAFPGVWRPAAFKPKAAAPGTRREQNIRGRTPNGNPAIGEGRVDLVLPIGFVLILGCC